MATASLDTSARTAEAKTLRLAVLMYLVVFTVKLITYLATGVMALFAEALHTLGDIFVSGFLLIALLWSRKVADEVHMFGYGRSQAAAALVAATLFVSFTSLRLYEEAIPRLISGEAQAYANVRLALIVLVFSMLAAAAPLVALVRTRSRGPAAKAQMWELVNDELGLIAALVGTVFAVAGYPRADPLAAVVIATIITWKAVSLFRENLSLLIGRSPGPDVVDTIRRTALSIPGVVGVHELRVEDMGPAGVHLGMHIEVPSGTRVEDADEIARMTEEAIHRDIRGAYCVIHVDPATPAMPRGDVRAREHF